jgi:NitT/TauT family transport system substrate-binding protein
MINAKFAKFPLIFELISVLVLLLLVSSCASATGPSASSAPPAPRIKLKVLYLQFLAYAPYFIADAEGYFAAQGLDVELVRVSSMAEGVPALLQGDVDVVAGTLSAAYLNAIGRGGRMIFVADKGYLDPKGCASGAIVGRPDLVKNGLTADKLRGLTFSGTVQSLSGYFDDKFLSSYGLTLKDVKLVNATGDLLSEALSKRVVDLGDSTEPLLTRLLQDQNGVIVAPYEQLFPDATFSFMLYGPSLLDRNPEAGKKFMVAYLQAVRQYDQGRTERNLDILSKATGLDRDNLKKICWQPIREDGQIKMGALTDYQSYLIRQKLLDNPVTDEKKLWDPTFINYAVNVLKK